MLGKRGAMASSRAALERWKINKNGGAWSRLNSPCEQAISGHFNGNAPIPPQNNTNYLAKTRMRRAVANSRKTPTGARSDDPSWRFRPIVAALRAQWAAIHRFSSGADASPAPESGRLQRTKSCSRKGFLEI